MGGGNRQKNGCGRAPSARVAEARLGGSGDGGSGSSSTADTGGNISQRSGASTGL